MKQLSNSSPAVYIRLELNASVFLIAYQSTVGCQNFYIFLLNLYTKKTINIIHFGAVHFDYCFFFECV